MRFRTTVTKQFKFSYGHSLPGYDGLCVNQHGHNCTMEVSISKALDGSKAPDGMICDFSDLKMHVKRVVINKLDHKNLNDIPINSFGTKLHEEVIKMKNMPTAENMIDC